MPTIYLPHACPTPPVRVFDVLNNWQKVEAWTLKNYSGLELEVITSGGIVTRFLVPGQSGVLADVVLGFDSVDAYQRANASMGATVRPVAGRVTAGRLNLEWQRHQLPL